MNPTFVLVHSPLVGPSTWSQAARVLRQRGFEVLLPELEDTPQASQPYWQQHAESIARAINTLPAVPVFLVAHSGAGALLPAVRQLIAPPVRAYIFVDAGIPVDGMSRLDLLASESPEFASQFRLELEAGGRFPTWSEADLAEILPDPAVRRAVIDEMKPRRLDFFTEPIPVFNGWPDALAGYVWLSGPYAVYANQALQWNWPVIHLPAGHFHMLVDPEAVVDAIMELLNHQG